MSQKTVRPFQKALKRFLKVIDCTQQLQVREKRGGIEEALGGVNVVKDQVQYRSVVTLFHFNLNQSGTSIITITCSFEINF